MKSHYLVVGLVFSLFSTSTVLAQNNSLFSDLSYCNVKDTLLADESAIISLPILEINNIDLLDSLRDYLSEAVLHRYGQYEDSNGVYFSISINTRPDDSSGLYVYISTSLNFFMHDNLVCHLNNDFVPETHKIYIMGCLIYDQYLVVVKSKRYIPTMEIQRFFSKTQDTISCHIYKKQYQEFSGKALEPSKYFSIPFLSKGNYVSPVWKRITKQTE